MPYQVTPPIEIETSQGVNVVVVQPVGQHVQYNCFAPAAGGAGVYAVFSADIDQGTQMQAMRALLEVGPHPENVDLGELVKEATIAASVVSVPTATAAVMHVVAQDCPDCKPGAKVKPFTVEQYKAALDRLAQRNDLTDGQRQQALSAVNAEAGKAGVL